LRKIVLFFKIIFSVLSMGVDETWERIQALDPLTGLPDRRGIRGGKKEEGEVVVFIDLDDFGAMNKEKGHEFGDDVLRKFALLLRKCSRAEDRVFRLGGDEFFLHLFGANEEEAQRAVSRIEEEAKSLSISFSYGIKRLEGDIREARREADEAAREQKKKKKELE